MQPFGPLEIHPYDTFSFLGMTKLILGTIPPFRFTHGEGIKTIEDGDVNFYYGSRYNCFWELISKNHKEHDFLTANTIRDFLKSKGIGISDIVQTCIRKREKDKYSALDKDLKILSYRNLNEVLSGETLKEILFTSCFGYEHFKLNYNIHSRFNCVILPSPSRSASRAIGKAKDYAERKGPNYNTMDYRQEYYGRYI